MGFDVQQFSMAFLRESIRGWLLLLGVFLLLGLAIGLLLSLARHGTRGFKVYFAGIRSYVGDLLSISPGRIYALTKLTLKEAVRRKALLVFVVFAILLMFAGWFLTDANSRPEMQVTVHVTFLLTAIAWLILPAVIFLSCWALPEDIRIRSLHTVVTKPARRLEIVAGRMLGMSLVAILVVSVMGLIGFAWIYRSVPASARDQLTCRVPLFGQLHFLTASGQPDIKGLNVGDTWDYRSFIVGDSRARAVWEFSGVDESTLVTEAPRFEDGTVGDPITGLKLECRFEAFRTVKGSERSVKQGLRAQYTVSYNPREIAFGRISTSEALRGFADSLRDAQFVNAATRLRELATKIEKSPDDLQPPDYIGLGYGITLAGQVLRSNRYEGLEEVTRLFAEAGSAGTEVVNIMRRNSTEGRADPVDYGAFVTRLNALADGLEKYADALHESLPRMEVTLEPFHIKEYHEGDVSNVQYIPRKLRFVADYETLARFLAGLFQEWNEAGRLVEGSSLKPGLVADLATVPGISPANAELLVVVLQEQINAGALTASDGRLTVAGGQRWFKFFDSLIQKDLLASQDPEGWMFEKDLLNDLVKDGILRIEVACLDDQMYIGMARPDLFIRKPDRPFYVGYCKALTSICLMLLLIIVLGVTVSSVVKGPVALFFTLTFFIVGQFSNAFIKEKFSGAALGMGTIESAVLIAQHRNPQVGMELPEATVNVIRAIDYCFDTVLWIFSRIVPDFTVFNTGVLFVENGFDVPFLEGVLPAILVFLGFLVPCLLLAGGLLKFRELEAK